MSWAEFVIRSISFWEEREYEQKLYREVAYQMYCGQFVWGKQKPKSKNEFWPIGEEPKKGVDNGMLNAFLKAHEKYEKERNGNSTGRITG